jgi:hypothetical protein
MLRGAIDLIHPEKVGGWMYSETGSVRGATVLAFVDDQCVGSGRIDLFRQDLADAGLGDGFLGFSFPITPPSPDDASRVVIRMDGSDPVLVPQGATIAAKVPAGLFAPMSHTGDSIEWMRSCGWLDPADVTFLKYIIQIGAYDHSLLRRKSAADKPVELMDPLVAAQPLFNLLCLKYVKVTEMVLHVEKPEQLVKQVLQHAGRPIPIVALTSAQNGALAVVEGSHLDDRHGDSLMGAIDYPYGPDRLMFLNLSAKFSLREPDQQELRVLVAS